MLYIAFKPKILLAWFEIVMIIKIITKRRKKNAKSLSLIRIIQLSKSLFFCRIILKLNFIRPKASSRVNSIKK